MGLIADVRAWLNEEPAKPSMKRAWYDLAGESFNFNGHMYPLGLNTTMPGEKTEPIENNFGSYVQQAYKGNSVVFACMATRLMLFSEARFQYQRMAKGRPGDLFGDPSLGILEHPWPSAVTADLLATAITDVDLAGNCYLIRRQGRIIRLEPDWVDILLGSFADPSVRPEDINADFLGIVYYPGGKTKGSTPEFIQRGEVAHFKLYPDPLARYRGMSWLTPIIREITADTAATTHKQKFFENGATANLVIKRTDSLTKEAFREWVQLVEEGHKGLANAYKTFYLDAGSDASVVGADMQQIEFKATQGAGETRIAAAARVHPAVVGLSEGMQGASLNSGNFMAARRLVADGFARPAWRNFAGSLETLVPPPSNTRLWYDDRDIAFLREDRKDLAEIQQMEAQTMRQLYDGGWKPESIVKAVSAQDWALLDHSGLPSVQNQPPATTTVPVEVVPPKPTNGKTPTPA